MFNFFLADAFCNNRKGLRSPAGDLANVGTNLERTGNEQMHI